MARTKTEIKKQITDAFTQNEHIISAYKLDTTKSFEEQFSLVSFENTIFEIFAIVLFLFEKIFDQHKKEVAEALSEQKPHTARWYRNKALAFQYGFDLIPDTDKFNNTGKTEDEIENCKIVKYSAVTESETESRLIVKIATEQGGELQPITAGQKASFESYMNEIKDAGVRITVISYPADKLRLGFKVVRNSLVLDEQGNNILTGTNPVQEAIGNYLKNLPFNGELSLMRLIDAIQQVEGVEDLALLEASSSYFDGDNYTNYESIAIKRIAKSGYFKIENLNIEYVV